MPLNWDHMTPTVVVIGDDDGYRGPIGSGFIVNIKEFGMTFSYVVTAAHVVEGQAKVEIEAVDASGQPLAPFHLKDWLIGNLQGPDVAIGLLYSEENAPRGPVLNGLDFASHAIDNAFARRNLKPGAQVYYVGLLAPLGKPMARTGTLGAVHIDDIPLNEYAYTAHLIDCRSYGGFSGSPVYLEERFASLTPIDPSSYADGLLDKAPPVGTHLTASALLGMFTAQYSRAVTLAHPSGDERRLEAVHGVGIVLPTAYIKDILYDSQLVEWRRMAAEERKARDDEDRQVSQTKASPKESHDMDERIKIDGDPEDVLRGLLATPPTDAPSTN